MRDGARHPQTRPRDFSSTPLRVPRASFLTVAVNTLLSLPSAENTAVLVLPLLPQDGSGTKIPFQFRVWIQVSRELKILQRKMKLSVLTTILRMSGSHIRTQHGERLSSRPDFSATTRPVAETGHHSPGRVRAA